MSKFKYNPKHPYANERGMVEVNDQYFEGLYLMGAIGEDKRMMVGNQPVVINYISDHMEPLKHMALDFYDAPIDSKSKFRRITREKGCIEVGNETAHMLKPRKRILLDRRQRRNDLRRAAYEIKNGDSQVLHELRNRPNKKYNMPE